MNRLRWLLVLAFMAGLVVPVQAGFINGGFEDGNFNGWTQDGGGTGGVGIYIYDGTNRNAILNVNDHVSTKDPFLIGLGVSVANAPTNVYSGNHSGRVENIANGARFSQIKQSAVWTDPDIFFAYRVVFEDPGHANVDNPHFQITLKNTTDNTVMFQTAFNSNNLPSTDIGGYKYTDWLIQNLNTSADIGDTLELTLLAADCSLTGHGGYVVLDGFGAVIPPQNPVPEPASLAMLGLGALGMAGYGWRRRKNAQ